MTDGTNERLTSAAALYVSGDTGKRVRMFNKDNQLIGLWLATFVSATELDLAGIVRTEIVTVQTIDGDNFVDLLDPLYVVAEHNGQALLRKKYQEVILQDGDRLELVRAVAGG